MSSSAGAVKVPLQLFGLEGRYATALYTAATKLKQLESVESELNQVQAAIKKSPKLRDAIVSPIINAKLLETTLKEVGTAAKLSSATTNLLVLLAENRRLKKIDGVINAFRQIMSAHRGEVICEVTTARTLDAGQRKQLEETLRVSNHFVIYLHRCELHNSNDQWPCLLFLPQKFVKSNETIQLNAKVDPAIIGGLVVSIGDKYVDMSVATKVKKYTDLISASA